MTQKETILQLLNQAEWVCGTEFQHKQVSKSSQGLKINANAAFGPWHEFYMPDYFCSPA
jgi:hypothetical protein